jgi:hypothetical protein
MISLYVIKAMAERPRVAYSVVRYTLKVGYRNLKIKVTIV